MVRAKKKGMTNGDYVYIVSALSDIRTDQEGDYWWLEGISGHVSKAEAEKAWHSVLTLVPRPFNQTKYDEFKKRVIDRLNDFPYYTNKTLANVSFRMILVKILTFSRCSNLA